MIAVREASRSDVATIHSFVRGLAIYEKLEAEHVGTQEELEETLFPADGSRPYAEVIISSYNGEDAGFALYFFNYSTFLSRPGLYLEDLYVKEEFRKHGIGKALLKRLAQIALEKKCGRMEWSALDWNTPAINFYKSLGAFTMDEWTTFRLVGDKISDLASAGESA